MLTLEFLPKLFNGYSFVIFEFFSAIILFLIAAYAYKCYKFNKNCKNKNLSISFLLMAIGFIAKISTNIIIHYNVTKIVNLGLFQVAVESTQSINIFYILGYFFYRFLTLLGLYIFYLTIANKENDNTLFTIYFIIITTIFSTWAYYVFHMTVLIFASSIARIYYHNYKTNKKKQVFTLFLSFILIAVAQAFYMFSKGNSYIYVLSEIIQLVGFILLLIVFIKTINKNVKKK